MTLNTQLMVIVQCGQRERQKSMPNCVSLPCAV